MPRYARVFLLPDGGVPVRFPLTRYEAVARGEERMDDLAGTTALFAIASMERTAPGTWEVLRVDGVLIRFDKKGQAEPSPLRGNRLDLDMPEEVSLHEIRRSHRQKAPVDPVLTRDQRAAVVAAALLSRPRKA